VTDRRGLEAFHPFARLNALLAGIPAGRPSITVGGRDPAAPVLLQIGEPQNQPPDFVAEELTRAAAGWSRYPPQRGTPEYRQACADWLTRRYALPAGLIDPQTMILPLPGTREGLFFAALAVTPGNGVVPPPAEGALPAILLPNPFYHVYVGAALAAGAEPVFVDAAAETDFLPDFSSLPPETLGRAALAYYCTPSNPQGVAAGPTEIEGVLRLARRHGFVVAFDECYAEIYGDRPPAGALQVAAALGGGLDNLLAFHSLSKRSSAPGLRCGFVAGAPALIDALDAVLRVGGAGVPLPVLAAGTRLWRAEEHVEANRARYRENFAVAERVLGNRFAYRRPDGGFFLWLDVGNGEAAAKILWREAGIRVLPGTYMCEASAKSGASGGGADPGGNPGTRYIRLALVYEPELIAAALERLIQVL